MKVNGVLFGELTVEKNAFKRKINRSADVLRVFFVKSCRFYAGFICLTGLKITFKKIQQQHLFTESAPCVLLLRELFLQEFQ